MADEGIAEVDEPGVRAGLGIDKDVFEIRVRMQRHTLARMGQGSECPRADLLG